jgi:hypothetical protein
MNPETEESREITFEVESPEESAMPGGIVALVRIRNIERNGRPFMVLAETATYLRWNRSVNNGYASGLPG